MNYSFVNKNEGGLVTLDVIQKEPDVTIIDFNVSFDSPCSPKPITVTWFEPCVDICSIWRSTQSFDHVIGPAWWKQRGESRLAWCAPVYVWLSNSSKNRLTVTVSDAKTPLEIAGGIMEEDATIKCEVSFFTQLVNPLKQYHAQIRLDRRDVRYEDALKASDKFWSEHGYKGAYVPEAASDAVYSTWYSFHQNLDVKKVLEQCKLAGEYGMKTVIVDDGWQSDNSARGYSQCGNWRVVPEKVPDMKKFVDGVHRLGMKFMLWYSVPFIGKQTEAYKNFCDMTLGDIGKEWECLDPRYPQVRKYLANTYVDALKAWGLDGFKLDFIDSFKLNPNTKQFDERWDTSSLEEGVDKLLCEVSEALKEINPDILIEFRQTYFGPAIRKYGNMFRVGDCPNDPLKNRSFGVSMRYILQNAPVHSDMLMWHGSDMPQAAAYQLITTLFCVPQISVMLDQISEEHKKVLKFYLDFWHNYKEILLGGALYADHPEALFSQVRAFKDGKLVAVAYDDPVIEVKDEVAVAAVNATGSNKLYICNSGASRSAGVVVNDCMGNTVLCTKIEMGANEVSAFEIPECGTLEASFE